MWEVLGHSFLKYLSIWGTPNCMCDRPSDIQYRKRGKNHEETFVIRVGNFRIILFQCGYIMGSINLLSLSTWCIPLYRLKVYFYHHVSLISPSGFISPSYMPSKCFIQTSVTTLYCNCFYLCPPLTGL